MGGHLLGDFAAAAILQILRDARRSKRVIAHARLDTVLYHSQ